MQIRNRWHERFPHAQITTPENAILLYLLLCRHCQFGGAFWVRDNRVHNILNTE
jgi:hypothetical protein